ncbi:ABC transporter permease [Furfurilactobacillus siliginis]|nr:ABC transporter permease [Furfurilactobacillus siliginis]
MYLGLKEMAHEKLRYALLTGVMLLIALVVFILAGLANGLSQGNRLAVDQWHADNVYLNQQANKSIAGSQLTTDVTKSVTADKLAPMNIASTVLRRTGTNKKINVALIGTTKDAFLIPKLLHGRKPTKTNEIIVSQDLWDRGMKLGDKIKLGQLTQTQTVVGSYGHNMYSITPTIYTDLATVAKIQQGNLRPNQALPIAAVVTAGDSKLKNSSNLQKLSMPDFINHLPGYTAEQTTLNAMIYFLFTMSLAIIGIFMYVLVLQKQALFGVLKVEGIGTGYILASVVTQAIIMSTIGVVVGLGLTTLFGAFAPTNMPFALDFPRLIIDAILLVLAATVGALLSGRTIARINPVAAIN